MYDDIPVIAQTSAVDLQYRVFGANGQLASNNDQAVGILQNKPQALQDASIRYKSRSRARVGTAVAIGDKLTVTSSGWLTVASSGGNAVAKSLEAVSSGGICEVVCEFANSVNDVVSSGYVFSPPTSSTALSGELNAREISHVFDPSSGSSSVQYALRVTADYQSGQALSSGGYVSPFGSVLKISGQGAMDKAVVNESQIQITDASSLTSLLFFEAVPSIVHSAANVQQAVGFYMANVSGVPNIDNIQSLRFMQCDQANTPSLINGPVYGEYGYSQSGAGAALSPAAGTGYANNRYYWPWQMEGRSTATVLTPFVYAIPFMVTEKWSPSRIGVEIAAALGSGTGILGIYNARGGAPVSLVAQAASTIDLTSATFQELTLSGVTLPEGMYYLALQVSDNVSAIFGTVSMSCLNGTSGTDLTVGTVANAVYMSTAYTGTLPSTFTVTGLTGTSNTIPAVAMRSV